MSLKWLCRLWLALLCLCIATEEAASADGLGKHLTTVFIILMENQNWSNIIGNPAAPFINNTLLPLASHAEQYFNPPGIHPSLPNYLWLEGGDSFGITDDGA